MQEEEVKTESKEKEKEIKWSYSRLSCYEKCPFQYKLKYVDKNYPKFGNVATDFGSAIHHAEEKIANAIQDNQPIDYIKIKNEFIVECAKVAQRYPKDWFDVNKDSGKTYEEQKFIYLRQLIYRLEAFMKDHPNYKILGAEEKIDYRYKDKYRFDGSIDRFLYDTSTNQYIIQDIKSWPIMEGKHDDERSLPIQLAVYSMAVAEKYNYDVNQIKCQYDLPLVNNIYDAGDPGFIDKAKKELDKLFAKIEAKDWKPKQSALCAWCPYSATNPDAEPQLKHLCPYHSIWDREVRNPKTSGIPFIKWEGMEMHEYIMEKYLKGSE